MIDRPALAAGTSRVNSKKPFVYSFLLYDFGARVYRFSGAACSGIHAYNVPVPIS